MALVSRAERVSIDHLSTHQRRLQMYIGCGALLIIIIILLLIFFL
jgi:hypothetical protein